jgi:hypothetical protein
MLYLGSWSGTSTYSNKWSIYQESTTEKNYFGSAVLIGTNTNSGYKLDVSGTVRGTTSAYFATSSGNVGVGTITPNLAADGKALTVSAGTSGNNLIGRFEVQGSRTETDAAFGGLYGWHQANLVGRVEFQRGSADNSGNIIFGTLNAGTYGQRMTITSGGNVGIGTDSAACLLQVQGALLGGFVNIRSFDSASMAANVGGGISFGGKYTSAGVYTDFGFIKGMKENGTSDDYAGYINFYTRVNGGSFAERMRITSGGTVTIQTPTSGTALLAYGKANEWTIQANASTTSSQSFGLKVVAGTNSSDSAMNINNAADTTTYFRVRGDGYIFSPPTYALTTASLANMNVQSDGTFVRSTASSARFKENINDWDGNGLNTILALKPKTFTYKADYYKNPELQMLGLIAEEVAEVSPFLAEYQNEDRTGQVENVRYATIVVPLIKAVQELKAEIEELKALIAAK